MKKLTPQELAALDAEFNELLAEINAHQDDPEFQKEAAEFLASLPKLPKPGQAEAAFVKRRSGKLEATNQPALTPEETS